MAKKKSGNSLIVPVAVGLIALISGAVMVGSKDDGKDKVKTESEATTTTKPEGTSTTSSTPSGSSTTTTAPDDGSDDCKDVGTFGRLFCDSSGSDPGAPTDEKCSTILGREVCVPTGGGGSGQPGGDVVLNLQKCQVDLNNIDYGFYHRGKLAVENFDAPFKGDVKTMEGQKEFLQDLVERGCVDPSAMASYARHLGIIPKDSDDATVNRLAVAYTTDIGRWQRHVNLMVTKLNGAVLVRLVKNEDANATTDGQRHIGEKRPPQVFKEPLKGSCPDIVEVWVQGEVYSFCPGCKQPVRRTPTAPPAVPVTPPCTICTPPSTPTTTTPGQTPTTTRPGTPTTAPPTTAPPTTAPPTTAPPTTAVPTTRPPRPMCPYPYGHIPVPPGGVGKCPKDEGGTPPD